MNLVEPLRLWPVHVLEREVEHAARVHEPHPAGSRRGQRSFRVASSEHSTGQGFGCGAHAHTISPPAERPRPDARLSAGERATTAARQAARSTHNGVVACWCADDARGVRNRKPTKISGEIGRSRGAVECKMADGALVKLWVIERVHAAESHLRVLVCRELHEHVEALLHDLGDVLASRIRELILRQLDAVAKLQEALQNLMVLQYRERIGNLLRRHHPNTGAFNGERLLTPFLST